MVGDRTSHALGKVLQPRARVLDPEDVLGWKIPERTKAEDELLSPAPCSGAESERSTLVSCTVSTSWADTEIAARVELALEGGVQPGCEEAGMTAHTCFNSRVKTGQRWSVV